MASRKRIFVYLCLLQAHAVSGHKAQGQTLPWIVLSHLYRTGKKGDLLCLLRDLGWFYTAASRTKTRDGLILDMQFLPLTHIQARRNDVLVEMARLQVIHEATHSRVYGTAATAVADLQRLQAAESALVAAKRVFHQQKRQKLSTSSEAFSV